MDQIVQDWEGYVEDESEFVFPESTQDEWDPIYSDPDQCPNQYPDYGGEWEFSTTL